MCKKIAKILKVPFIGCANHRLALALSHYLEQRNFNPIIKKIGALMAKISKSAIYTARLHNEIDKVVRLLQKTRWISKFRMISRYREIKDHLHKLGLPQAMLLTDQENRAVEIIYADLEFFKVVTEHLQSSGTNPLDARLTFDALIDHFGEEILADKLGTNASIIQDPDFETALKY